MKKTLIALAAVAATGAAFAQSTVTISGGFDFGVAKPVGSAGARLDGSNNRNTLAFSGTEDLGGGLKATFNLVSRFSPESGKNDTNSDGTERPQWMSESSVGLAGGFGAVKIGRQLTALQGPLGGFDVWGTATQGSVAGGVLAGYLTDASYGTGGQARADVINYSTPVFNGFSAAASYGFKTANSGSTAPTTEGTGKALTSLYAQYANGPVVVGAGTETSRANDKATAVMASYDLGVAKVMGAYTIYNPIASTVDTKGYMIGAAIPMNAFTFKVGYGTSKPEGGAATVKKSAIGFDYALSKRTFIYTNYASDSAKTTEKTGYDIGVRHTF